MMLSEPVTVGAGAIERGDLQLMVGDIKGAVDWFSNQTGQEPDTA